MPANVTGALTTAEKQELVELRKQVRQLYDGARDPPKGDGLLREGADVLFTLIDAEKARYLVTTPCNVLDVSESGYHAWRKRPPSRRATDHARITANNQGDPQEGP